MLLLRGGPRICQGSRQENDIERVWVVRKKPKGASAAPTPGGQEGSRVLREGRGYSLGPTEMAEGPGNFSQTQTQGNLLLHRSYAQYFSWFIRLVSRDYVFWLAGAFFLDLRQLQAGSPERPRSSGRPQGLLVSGE